MECRLRLKGYVVVVDGYVVVVDGYVVVVDVVFSAEAKFSALETRN